MTPRSFFAIVIKILALYLILESLAVIPEVFSSLMSFFRFGGISGSDAGGLLAALSWITLIVVFYVFFLRICLFKTNWIIDKLRLDQGFDEVKFELNLHRSTVLQIAIIVIGTLIVVDTLPLLCREVISYFHFIQRNVDLVHQPAVGWLVFYFVKFFIGLFMMSTSRLIVNFVELKRKKPVQQQQGE
ncbi:MAG: hypothetical protein JST19_13960 [Bacteroidetes bacterium]|nr:hypothetical protein [Bacteroidota bacterium]